MRGEKTTPKLRRTGEATIRSAFNDATCIGRTSKWRTYLKREWNRKVANFIVSRLRSNLLLPAAVSCIFPILCNITALPARDLAITTPPDNVEK